MTDVTDAQAEPQAAPTEPTPSFSDFPIHPDIVAALAGHGITSPFPIQAMTLPVALGGHDIIGQAKTGTGKTLGFGIPILNRVVAPGDDAFAGLPAAGKPQALAVAPTRELAVQVAGDLERAGAKRGIRVLTVYGGRAYEPQVEALKRGVEVVVGTPGRLIDLAQQGHLDLGHARIVVLDEADEMLDLGFLPDVEKILAMTPAGRQTMLFSATMPGAVVTLARRYMNQPTHIRAMGDDQENAHTVKAVEQHVYRAHAMDKVEMLARMLQAEGRGLTIVFSRTKRTAAKVADELVERGFAAASIHGDLGQGAREQALRAFRNGKVDILVATDVAARGIDVENVTHVINYQCPEDEKTYLHRIGRTARAGNTGTAVTFVDWDDLHRWGMINRVLDLGIPEPVETYSSSPHLYTDLAIPEGTKGRLPRAKRTREGLDAEVLEDLGETGKSGGRGGRGGRDAGRGGRDSGRGGRDGGRGEGRSSDRPAEGGERPRRNRNRRRTQGGKPAGEGAQG
ncbi:DEAD/DEAH box helicase [Phycicoccus sp. MAQZ13P-2]|uniref:DEAD/DEAH box helicase n=1 Tax=Phycicoccus mangrovi TaxID=2840470 RepID=UPI001C004B59|nr:DEAD/DEAH box helicase [Phycicoccus mangrovi]MBT9254089.1 DEAD/DEAH box helicase [Phycicoccus mangrovi]MBT9272469.1 DEAD/DEAH box helicase [Phycicoccus mangrovi]